MGTKSAGLGIFMGAGSAGPGISTGASKVCWPGHLYRYKSSTGVLSRAISTVLAHQAHTQEEPQEAAAEKGRSEQDPNVSTLT